MILLFVVVVCVRQPLVGPERSSTMWLPAISSRLRAIVQALFCFLTLYANFSKAGLRLDIGMVGKQLSFETLVFKQRLHSSIELLPNYIIDED